MSKIDCGNTLAVTSNKNRNEGFDTNGKTAEMKAVTAKIRPISSGPLTLWATKKVKKNPSNYFGHEFGEIVLRLLIAISRKKCHIFCCLRLQRTFMKNLSNQFGIFFFVKSEQVTVAVAI